ncbi:hypothetical protein [Microbacterium marinilacus]|uniref:Uncharacterized protein n=1 Tax=Microbacterium marinilacus TaxID=415209 RepID=A0ABP7BSD2_9MICO|nr:hypothetical protein [Microbacterium marinilacus]MBY0689264.1 hypothetical protein [Microbacterium marinilacus]
MPEDDGLDFSLSWTVPDPTGIAQVSVPDGGENSIVVVPGVNAVADLND